MNGEKERMGKREEGRVERKELLLVGVVDFVVPLVQRGATNARQGRAGQGEYHIIFCLL